MLPITSTLLTSTRNRPFLRDPNQYALRQLKGLVAHWTANTDKGANATANRNYFNGPAMFASSHYISDDHSILRCVPDHEVAYHAGGLHYLADGENLRATHPSLTPNFFVLGLEMCVNSDGDWNLTRRNSVDLLAFLLHKYQFSLNDLYRHHDITGKDCPKMLLDATAWTNFKTEIGQAMAALPNTPFAQGRVSSVGLNVRSGPGTQHGVLTQLKKGDEVHLYEETGGWVRISPISTAFPTGKWVNKGFLSIFYTTKKGRILAATGADVLAGPQQNATLVDNLPNGAFVSITGEKPGWLEVDGPDRWVPATEVVLFTVRSGAVANTDSLNVRNGPGTTYKILRKLAGNAPVTLLEEEGNWLRLAPNEWVSKQYVHIA